jgi:carboxylate-amine ligase
LSDGFDLVVISHHPTESKFNAPPNYIRHDYWQWALTAATTFGPDINISVPEELSKRIEPAQVAARINFYMPSVVAMTLAAPLTDGKLWRIRRRIGKSIRTYRRSIWAPLFYVHEEPSLRFEFKGFEMSRCLEDYNVFFLLSLALLLDETLTEQGADESRIYDLGRVAVVGLESQYTRDVASKVMESAEKIANRFGLSREGMDEFWNRLQSKRIPADDIISIHQKENSVAKTLSRLVGLYSRNDLRAEGAACATGTR